MDLQRDITSPSSQKYNPPLIGASFLSASDYRIFAYDDLKSIILDLEREAQSNTPVSEWAQSTIDVLNTRSPTSLHVSLSAMRETINRTRYHAFQREYELASKFMKQPDLVEGITARLIERREPKWSLGPEALKADGRKIVEHGHFNDTLEESFYMFEEGRRDTITAERGLFKYSLPMEASVLATLMRGKLDGTVGDDVHFTRKQLVEFLVGEHLGKAGLERKLNHILDTRTIELPSGQLIWKFDDAVSS
jgi:3-hydroxyisobutyryl-CoA hydrolase